MKKILVLSALLIFVTCNLSFAAALGSAGTAAVTSTSGLQIYGGITATDAAGTASVLLGKMSKGVNFGANYTTTAYSLMTKHTSGTKAYGTAYNSTAIYFKEIGLTAIVAGDLPSEDQDSFSTGWTSM
ncbi:MAG: hypothetical protein A2091_06575 [Desulfuromonadales bacterium GWD2_61_12]|nr:MAG: hypothetical protein A2005_05035 [Desulfuromonadales bacterium GWC2_61_20]OGR32579.1 MAG: hypothetical protein A2091_06575 [Desulfuromonadales bacterium GWD2_61_12]